MIGQNKIFYNPKNDCILFRVGLFSFKTGRCLIVTENNTDNSELKTVTIQILNRDYQVNCPTGAEAELKQAAQYLSQKMVDIQSKTRQVGTERVAIMAALNIAHELISQNEGKEAYVLNISEKIERLTNKLANSLTKKSTSTATTE